MVDSEELGEVDGWELMVDSEELEEVEGWELMVDSEESASSPSFAFHFVIFSSPTDLPSTTNIPPLLLSINYPLSTPAAGRP